MLLLNINIKLYMGSPMVIWQHHIWPWVTSSSLRFWVGGHIHGIHVLCAIATLIKREFVDSAGFSADPPVFPVDNAYIADRRCFFFWFRQGPSIHPKVGEFNSVCTEMICQTNPRLKGLGYGQGIVAALGHLGAPSFLSFLRCSTTAASP